MLSPSHVQILGKEQFLVSLDALTNDQHLSLSVGRARGLKIKGKNGESLLIVPSDFLVFSLMKP